MDYTFNGEIAKLYGVDEAVFIHNIYWWTAKNEANSRHFYDGRYWTYNTTEAFTVLFPFWTRHQVIRIIGKLQKCNAILTANYNQKGFDRTKWYALSETVQCIYAKAEMHLRKRDNAFVQTGQTIPDSKPYSKPDINTDTVFALFWKEYPKKIAKPDAFKAFTALKVDEPLLQKMLDAIKKQKTSEMWTKENGQFIPYPATWLRQTRWEDELQSKPDYSDKSRYDNSKDGEL